MSPIKEVVCNNASLYTDVCTLRYISKSENKERFGLILQTVRQNVITSLETVSEQIIDTVFGSPVRLCVTGLTHSGKTVFITSLTAHMLKGAECPCLAQKYPQDEPVASILEDASCKHNMEFNCDQSAAH